ncbi:MAG: HDIG domain-containing protein, partial [Desulfarculaceae bacterium]
MDFDQARALMESQISEETLRKHCLASAAVCRALARRLEEDEELWAVTGLLHDLDFEQTKDNPSQHGVVAAEILEKEGLPAEAITAIKAHNAELTGVERTTP